MDARRVCALLACLCVCLAACEPEATPMPVIPPTSAPPTPTPGAPQPIRYAITAETAALIPDLTDLEAAADLTLLTEPLAPADFDGRYAIIAAYGDQPGWTRAPVVPQVALVINPAAPPLDTPELAAALRLALFPDELSAALNIPGAEAAALNSATRTSIREQLANAGYPDGFDVRLAAAAPGADAVVAQLAALHIGAQRVDLPAGDIAAALAAGQIHAALVVWAGAERDSWTAQVGADNVIDLYTLPISYWTIEGLSITFTEAGFPIPVR